MLPWLWLKFRLLIRLFFRVWRVIVSWIRSNSRLQPECLHPHQWKIQGILLYPGQTQAWFPIWPLGLRVEQKHFLWCSTREKQTLSESFCTDRITCLELAWRWKALLEPLVALTQAGCPLPQNLEVQWKRKQNPPISHCPFHFHKLHSSALYIQNF